MHRILTIAVPILALWLFISLFSLGAGFKSTPTLAYQPGGDCHTFSETGKRVCGRFLQYWREHGGLAQQGYPISDEFVEKSDLDGKEYRVQYFERAVFELHPENQPPNDVLLSHLGVFQFRRKYPGGDSSSLTTKPGTLAAIAPMSTARACHFATLLKDGKVLVAGGFEREGVTWATTELYDPASKTFKPAGTMVSPRACPAMVLLDDGRLFIAGGSTREWLQSTELYDPASGRFTPGPNMSVRRGDVSATLLKNGKVLLAGGYDGTRYASAEIYDPQTSRLTPTGSMFEARSGQIAVLLKDGKVLLVGGTGANGSVLSLVELYDPASGRFTVTGSLTTPRRKHAATLLADGRVLVVGGSDARDGRGRYTSAEIYDPMTGKFSPTGSMAFARFKFNDAITPLKDGRIFVGGGNPRPEIYNPATGTFTSVEGQADAERSFSTATLLPNGGVLLLGGYDTRIEATKGAWLYEP